MGTNDLCFLYRKKFYATDLLDIETMAQDEVVTIQLCTQSERWYSGWSTVTVTINLIITKI